MADSTTAEKRRSRILAEIRRTFTVFIQPAGITELRILDTAQGTVSGCFDNADDFAQEAVAWDGKGAIYFIPNVIDPRLLARAHNRTVLRPKATTSDADILARRFILIDCDPRRPTGISSTDAEHEAAIARALSIRDWLVEHGVAAAGTVLVDSGNGAQLHLAVDLPPGAESDRRAQRFLETLDALFSDQVVKIDPAMYNAARLVRLPGLLNGKGDSVADRQHRRARFLDRPWMRAEPIAWMPEPTSVEIIDAIIALGPPEPEPPKRSGRAGAALDLNAFLDAHAEHLRVRRIDEDWRDRHGQRGLRVILERCVFNPDHTGGCAVLLQFAGGVIWYGCRHNSCRGKGWADARDVIEPGWRDTRAGQTEGGPARDPSPHGPDEHGSAEGASSSVASAHRPSQATILVGLAITSQAEFFHTADQTGFATVVIRDHRATYRIRSTGMRLWLRQLYRTHSPGAPNAQALHDTIDQLDATAVLDGPAYPVSVRIGELDGAIYLDLGGEDWSAIKITARGWDVVATPPVRFQRMRGTLEIPRPTHGGDITALKTFVNAATNDDFRLTISWLVMALHPKGPYPLLVYEGEQGTAKSLAQRCLRQLIDPHTTPLRSEPKDVRDLMIAATNGWVAGFDNISSLSPWMSDALCRLATGAGFGVRANYTDMDEVLFSAMRPVMMNGIVNPAQRADLLERALIIQQLPLEPIDRREEAALLADFETKRPALLGALLDALVSALRDRAEAARAMLEKPRMADFAVVSAAAAPAIGWTADQFAAAYKENRAEADAVALEASPLTQPLLALAAKRTFKDTASVLLARLCELAEPGIRQQRGWPKGPGPLAAALRRLAPSLRNTGVRVTFHRTGRLRTISLEKEPEPTETASPSSPGASQSGAEETSSPGTGDDGDGEHDGSASFSGNTPMVIPSDGCGEAEIHDWLVMLTRKFGLRNSDVLDLKKAWRAGRSCAELLRNLILELGAYLGYPLAHLIATEPAVRGELAWRNQIIRLQPDQLAEVSETVRQLHRKEGGGIGR
jgi:hypothetical protein